ncbi:hypothetical protein F2A38_04200 [Pseudomonas chlororaphis]|uniref:Uncharacterized protein n=1 Tax=Pseudomonas chlororaphis TaxID=587753 RepID=A0AB34C9V9_9PSED|nr:hypothetical protein F2A38_04200 [Pseudomonas chlororaphis]
MATHESFLMDGLRAVFERGMLAQRPLLIRTPARPKRYMNIPACLLCLHLSVAAAAGCDRLRSRRALEGPAGLVAACSCGYRTRLYIGFGQSMNKCSRAKRRAR